MPERKPSEHVHKILAGHKIRKADDGRYTFTISTGRVDRDNDTVNPNGWDLGNYKSNPVVLFAHQNRMPPVARAENVGIRDGALKADVIFAEPGTYPLADTVRGLVDQDILRATSVGFIPTKWAFDEERGGFDFLAQELYEFSIVPIPANPDALRRAMDDVDFGPLEEWAEEILTQRKGSGLWVSKDVYEGMEAAVAPPEPEPEPAPDPELQKEETADAGGSGPDGAHATDPPGSTPGPANPPRLRVLRSPRIHRYQITREQVVAAVQNAVKEECQAAVRFAAGRLD